jgi:glucosylceramidase
MRDPEGPRTGTRSGSRVVVSLVVSAVCCALVAACTAQKPQRPDAGPSSHGQEPAAHAWMTTSDGRLKLADRGPVSFGPRGSADPDILVENGQRYQGFFGVGASITGSSSVLLNTLSADARSRVMHDIFDRRRGIGLSLLRQPVGASDFSSGSYTYDDVGPGGSDPGLTRFDLGRDRREVVPLLVAAARVNPSLAVVLSPWSAPAWMKTSGSLVGGSLRPEYDRVYADYLAKAAKAYLAAGVPVTGLTVQNEPSFSPPSYPGMTLDTEHQRALLRDHLHPALDRAGLNLHLWALDDNFERWPDADALLSDPATRAAVYGVAFHCYGGDVSALRTIRDRHPGVAVAVSECSGGAWSGGFAHDLRYEARTLLVGAIRNGAAWLVKWNLALDPNGGPQNGGCRDCRGLVTVDPSTGTVTPSAAYYAFGHVGRFVTPGARVIGATARRGSGLAAVAFRNPDGSHVLVVYNDAAASRRVTVGVGRRSFAARMPAGALGTFTW